VLFGLAVATATSPYVPEAGVLTSRNAGIFGVPDHRIADCQSFGVCRVLRKHTAEHKISLNKVRNLVFYTLRCLRTKCVELTCYREVIEDPDVDDKISSKPF
jgi:hypothetical protein